MTAIKMSQKSNVKAGMENEDREWWNGREGGEAEETMAKVTAHENGNERSRCDVTGGKQQQRHFRKELMRQRRLKHGDVHI